MVLSIGMIVKNEEEYLEQCLTALQPILNSLDSELIIADTGSTDRTVEIAKKFTDNVYHFEWINDFAAARNSTLERAKGDWYMFIDADEIAVDCTDIIKFFKSGEYKKYYSATYVQKSYTDTSNNDLFSEIRVPRIIKKEKDSTFVGRIHETFSYIKLPAKYLDLTVDHYGYRFHDKGKLTELAYEKNKRNLEGLFKELEVKDIEKRNPNVFSEIAECYFIIDDYDNGLKYIDHGLDVLPHDRVFISRYYLSKISALSRIKDEDGIFETCAEYFDKEKNPWHTKDFASDCYVYFWRGYVYYKMNNYRAAISDYVKCFDLYKKYTNNKLNTEELIYSSFRVNTELLKAAYDIFFRCCHQERQYALANEYTRAIPLEKYFEDQNFMVNHLNIRIVMMENLGYQGLDELYRQLDDFGKEFLLTGVRRRAFTTSPENRTVIIKKLTALGEMASELVKIYKGYFDDNAPSFELIKAFLEKYGSENSDDLLYIMLEHQMDITPFLLTEDFFADRAVQIVINFFPYGIEAYENYNIDNISQEGLLIATSLYGWIMLRVMERDHSISRLFETYGELGVKWYNTFGESEDMPGDIRAAMLVNDVVAAKESGNKDRFTNAVHELKNTVRDLMPLADTYRAENSDVFKTVRVNPEFEQLAVQVKRNIRDLIGAGNIGDARKLLKEFEGISPNDPDIDTLKDDINNSLQ